MGFIPTSQMEADAAFYIARDTLLGLNNRCGSADRIRKRMTKALANPLLSVGLRTEGEWLLNIGDAPDSARKRFVIGRMLDECPDPMDAALDGYPPAMVLASGHTDSIYVPIRDTTLILRAAELGDPGALYALSCGKNINLLRKAASYGHTTAKFHMSRIAPTVCEQIYWTTRISDVYHKEINLNSVKSAEDYYHSGMLLSTNSIDVGYSRRAINYYRACLDHARDAANATILTFRRLGIYRDIQKLIGCMVWDMRYDWIPLYGITDAGALAADELENTDPWLHGILYASNNHPCTRKDYIDHFTGGNFPLDRLDQFIDEAIKGGYLKKL